MTLDSCEVKMSGDDVGVKKKNAHILPVNRAIVASDSSRSVDRAVL